MSILIVLCILLSTRGILTDRPCAVRTIPKESVVCVCNATYCDEIKREIPKEDFYVIYTSSQSGLRFHKSYGKWKNSASHYPTLEINPTIKYQTIEGFGGSVTDAASINWRSLSEKSQRKLIKAYFSKNGLEYNMVRTPIGASDFSTHPYAYNDFPENDTFLTNFTLTPEDIMYKIPMIKAIMKTSLTPVHIMAATWSPPKWMKTRYTYGGINRLKKSYYQTYADYHLKFLQRYKEAGVPIWALTTTNEPINGVFNLIGFNCLGWDINDMGEWIVNNFGPTIRNSEFKDIKIIGADDQRFTVPYWIDMMQYTHPKALEYIDGIGVHFYTDEIIPASVFVPVSHQYPDKFIISTEACEGSQHRQRHRVLLGSWHRAKSYITDIIEDLNYNLTGWIDWNLCLDPRGGPNWANNFADAAIIVNKTNDEFIKQPMFYAMGHFSKFIPRGSRRIKIVGNESTSKLPLNHVAFITPRETIVVVLHNEEDAITISLKIGKRRTILELNPHSITTIEILNQEDYL